MKTEVINYQYKDKDYLGYVAYPDKDLAPLVLIAHTWAGRDSFVDDTGQENPDKNIICTKIYFDTEASLSEEIDVASVQGSQQQNPSVYATHTGTYHVAWEDMRIAADIEQRINFYIELDA